MNNIRLVVGLGNPGSNYYPSRHNAGFWFIDALASKYQANLHNDGKFWGIIGKFSHQQNDVYLLKPQTYMNLSGKSVLCIMNFFKILPKEVLVAHDELDFTTGIVKLKFAGGSAGHNGLKDISRLIGNDYWRLRIGIDHPKDKHKVADYVLKSPNIDDKIEIDNAIDRVLSLSDTILAGNFESAAKQLHTKL